MRWQTELSDGAMGLYALAASDIAALALIACCLALAYAGVRVAGHRHLLAIGLGASAVAFWWTFARSMPPPERYLQPALVPWFALLMAGLTVLWWGLARHYLPARPQQADTLALALAVANGAMIAAMAGFAVAGWPMYRMVPMVFVLAQTLPMAALGLYAARAEPATGHTMSALWLLAMPGLGLLLIAAQGHGAALRYVAMLPLLGACIAVLPGVYLRTHRLLRAEVDARSQAELALRAKEALLEATNKTLKQSLHRALSAEQARERFLALARHEIRTPLAGLQGGLELLASEQPANQPADAPSGPLALVQQSASRLHRLLENLLSYALSDSDPLAPPMPTDVKAALRDGVARWRTEADAKGLTLCTDIEALPESLVMHGDKLEKAVDGLMDHAIQRSGSGSVSLQAVLMPGPPVKLCVRVIDNGPPVDPVIFAESLSPGVATKVEPASSGHDSALRLGLAVSASIVRQLDGKLSCERLPAGTNLLEMRVPVRLNPGDVSADAVMPTPAPVFPGTEWRASPVATAGEPLPAASALCGKRVLVVDDNAVVRKVLVLMLKRMGVRVTTCQTGGEAVPLAQRYQFDAVLMDLSMPGMDGIEATRRIRADEVALAGRDAASPGVPIIGISAHAGGRDMARCLAAGMSCCLSKPISGPQLARMLESSLGLT
jgi:CheY-like chemotaxis protein